MRSLAYCDKAGVIHFGPEGLLPPGKLPIATGPGDTLRRLVSARARLAHDNETLLVPGIPEALHDDARLDALIKFNAQLQAELNADAAGRK